MAMADDLWRECAAWLTRCKVIPPDHKANWPDSEIRVLALTLRDGVLLCNLINFLDGDAMDMKDFNRKPQMAQFLCCQNIKLFVDCCKNHFGIRETDLFEPTMLYSLTNFHRVLITLSKLSQCRRVQQMHPNLLGFNAQLSPTERSHSDEDIYKDLHSTNNNHKSIKDEAIIATNNGENVEVEPSKVLPTDIAEKTIDGDDVDDDEEDDDSNDTKENGSFDTLLDDEEDEEEMAPQATGDRENNLRYDNDGKTNCWKIMMPSLDTVENLTWSNRYEERAYEDLCYVTISSEV